MFGFIQEFIRDPDSPTGYGVRMIVDRQGGDAKRFPASEKVFQMQFDPHYEFPLIGEYCFEITLEGGVVADLVPAVKGGAKAAYSFGSPKTVGSVVKIGDGWIEFTDFAEQYREGRLVYYEDYKKLAAREVSRGTRIALSPDATVYCLDWTKDETTLSLVDMAFLKKVVGDNVYWMDIQSLHGRGDVYDCIMIFRNYKKDPETFEGDLAKKHYSREQLTKPKK